MGELTGVLLPLGLALQVIPSQRSASHRIRIASHPHRIASASAPHLISSHRMLACHTSLACHASPAACFLRAAAFDLPAALCGGLWTAARQRHQQLRPVRHPPISHSISSHPIPSHPIPSHPSPVRHPPISHSISSHPIPSHPIPFHPIPSHPISPPLIDASWPCPLQTHVEMESITIGGIAMGFGIETNSHKYGLFQESVLACARSAATTHPPQPAPRARADARKRAVGTRSAQAPAATGCARASPPPLRLIGS
jgi:hypothetical protein